MVEGKWFTQGGDISQPLALRQAVFGTAADDTDALAQQLLVYREGAPVGAARMYWRDGDFHADYIGVLPAERGKGFGDLLMRLLLYKAETHGAKSLVVECPAELLAFFARYGFAAQGESEGETLTLRAPIGGCGAGCAQCGGCKP